MLGRFLHVWQHIPCCPISGRDARSRPTHWASVAPRSITDPGAGEEPFLQRCSGSAEAAEDGERVLRSDLPHELAARLGLAVQALRELSCLLFGGDAHDQVVEAAHDRISLLLKLIGELLRLAVRLTLDPHLPRRI